MGIMDFLPSMFAERKSASVSSLPDSKILIESAQNDPEYAINLCRSSLKGLSEHEASKRRMEHGLNEVAKEKKESLIAKILKSFQDPLTMLLLFLAIISALTHDLSAVYVICVIIVVSLILRLFQERKASNAVQQLKSMVKTTATVIRHGEKKEIPLEHIVPGDLIRLSAGDMVPADVRIIDSKDLFVNQSALTGEALPVDKHAPKVLNIKNPLESSNLCFMGTNVESGTATAVVISTGKSTYFGSLANTLSQETVTSFDKGIKNFTWLMIKFIMVMVLLVFFINGFSKGNWLEAFLFALAVAIGLTPEMLPMIVAVNLSKGAIVMSKKKVIVKKLDSIQNFGAMDVLCTDKTGTITQGKVVLEKHIDIFGNENNDDVLNYTYLNSFYQTGLKNIMDEAVLEHFDVRYKLNVEKNYRKIDEVTFDFVRKRMSVVVQDKKKNPILICKGAVDQMLSVCKKAKAKGKTFKLGKKHTAKINQITNRLNSEGFRVIAIALKETPKDKTVYSVADEKDMTLIGFIGFLDPPKETAMQALASLHEKGVKVKILTGDNEIVTKKICIEVKLPVEGVLLGHQIENMSQEKLENDVESTTIFARLLPNHKERIIKALQKNGHTVGFLGDGINDTSALKAADVGISVDTAVDVAKESSSIVLLEKSLLVLEDGVTEGRKVFGNITKYIKMTASSNFGNMLSVVGASIFLPFLPMLPIQILVNNLLYDFSQTTIPTDNVDEDYIVKPRQWSMRSIKRFIFFLGPVSSVFDYAAFYMMLYIFGAWNNPALFQTGWFIVSIVTQTFIIHIIRTNKIPFMQSRASFPVVLTSFVISAIGIFLVFPPLGKTLGFVQLPLLYWPLMILILLAYMAVAHSIKSWLIRKNFID